LLPFVDKYLAAVEKRRREEDDDASPLEAPARKAACPPATPAAERYDLVVTTFAASSVEELESLQKLLTATIDKRKRPASSFIDIRTAAAASSSR